MSSSWGTKRSGEGTEKLEEDLLGLDGDLLRAFARDFLAVERLLGLVRNQKAVRLYSEGVRYLLNHRKWRKAFSALDCVYVVHVLVQKSRKFLLRQLRPPTVVPQILTEHVFQRLSHTVIL